MTLDAFQAYCERWPVVWVLAKGSHLIPNNAKMEPALQSMLRARQPEFVSPDGATSVFRFTWGDADSGAIASGDD